MRLSVNPRKGFTVKRAGQSARVMMDGRQLERVFWVDTVAGVAGVADIDRKGNLRIDRNREEVVERRLYGPMRVELKG